MIVIIGCAVVVCVTIVAIVRSKKPLSLILEEAKYDMLYNVLGSRYLMHDFVMRGKNKTDLTKHSGKVAVITGGTRGIGLEVIRMLLKCDIHIIIGCRNPSQAENIKTKFREDGITTGGIDIFLLDISAIESVNNFANQVKLKFAKINYLINSAGIMFGPYMESRDGFESQFSTNYLGHFLLTHLLLPELKAAGEDRCFSRIVNVSSCAHTLGDINFEDINNRMQYVPGKSYAQSKLAQMLSTNFLNGLMLKENAKVQVHSVHPGVVNTELLNDTQLKKAAPWMPGLLFKTPEQGAVPIVHACLSPSLEGKGGTYIHNCIIYITSEKAQSTELQEKLFQFSKKLLKIEKFSELL